MPDHLDIYGTAAAVEEAFIEFSEKLKTGGTADPQKWIADSKAGKGHHGQLKPIAERRQADTMPENIRIEEGSYYLMFREWTGYEESEAEHGRDAQC